MDVAPTDLFALSRPSRRRLGARVSDDIEVDLWSKFSRLSVFSGMTAVTRSPMGVLRSDPDLLAMLVAACEETIRVGRARGVSLSPTLMDEILQMVHSLRITRKRQCSRTSNAVADSSCRGSAVSFDWELARAWRRPFIHSSQPCSNRSSTARRRDDVRHELPRAVGLPRPTRM